MAVPPPPPNVPAPPPLVLRAPQLIATGTGFALSGRGANPRGRVQLELKLDGRWRPLAAARADGSGAFERDVRPATARPGYRLRATTPDGRDSKELVVRSRNVTLDAIGDVNLGDAAGNAMAIDGTSYPWTSVGPLLSRADVAFGNLECAISTRGAPVPKEFNFRGTPAALKAMHDVGGVDVVNLANNHAGDYGKAALLDTLTWSKRYGMTPVGAGASLAAASKPQVVDRLGLRIAFVGFSNILPAEFWATPGSPGTDPATLAGIRASVAAAKKQADVVVATFHWGIELDLQQNADQEAFAQAALDAGATAVIGGHPHVLQPVKTLDGGRRVVAYSLGNFVFGSARPTTVRTGILELQLSARGVERTSFQHAQIEGSKPVLRGRPALIAATPSSTASDDEAAAG